MKKGYGKTYVKIILLILVIVASIWGCVHFLKGELDVEQIETVKTDMLLIQGKIKIIAEKVKIKEKDVSYIGQKIKEKAEEETIKKLQDTGIININEEGKVYYVLESQHLEELDLPTVKLTKGYYIVEYSSGEVIYSEGVEDKENNRVYTLSEIENIK